MKTGGSIFPWDTSPAVLSLGLLSCVGKKWCKAENLFSAFLYKATKTWNMSLLRLFWAGLESQEERVEQLVWLRGLSIWFSDKLIWNYKSTFFPGQELVLLSARQEMNTVWLKFQELVSLSINLYVRCHKHVFKNSNLRLSMRDFCSIWAGCGRVSSHTFS